MKRLRKLLTHSRKNFQSSPFWEDLISTRSSFYTLTRVLLVLVLLLANLMRKTRNMLSPMHPKATTRLRTTTLHTSGNALLLCGLSYISGLIFMASSSLCIPTTNLSSGWWPTISSLGAYTSGVWIQSYSPTWYYTSKRKYHVVKTPHYLWRFLRSQARLRLDSNSTCILCI